MNQSPRYLIYFILLQKTPWVTTLDADILTVDFWSCMRSYHKWQQKKQISLKSGDVNVSY